MYPMIDNILWQLKPESATITSLQSVMKYLLFTYKWNLFTLGETPKLFIQLR